MAIILQRQIVHLSVSPIATASIQQEMSSTCSACNDRTCEGAGNSGRRRMFGMCNTSSTAEGHEDENNVRHNFIANQVSEVLLLTEGPVYFSEGE